MDPKGWLLAALFGRWRYRPELQEGYSILLPMPADMPFLLRLALEGFRGIDTSHCRQIIVIPDGSTRGDISAIEATMRELSEPRIQLVRPRRRDLFFMRHTPEPHWLQLILGAEASRCRYAIVHDVDAFFLGRGDLEGMYQTCDERGLYTLGISARCDPFFQQRGMRMPCTWELMFFDRMAAPLAAIPREGPPLPPWRHRSRFRYAAVPPVR